MIAKRKTSRQELLISAGKLFAEHGYDGVTTRMISESAGVRLSGIHYHFSNKENLYIETFRYAHDKEDKIDFLEVLAEAPELGRTRQGQAQIIQTTILRFFRHIFNPARPSWETKLLVREIVAPSSALPALAETFMQTNIVHSEKFCRMVRPEISDMEAAIWADTLFAHIFLYILTKKPIEMMRGSGWLTEDFFSTAAGMVARFMILELDLPLPEDIRKENGRDPMR
jgi:AcrR family transcriptional regulator